MRSAAPSLPAPTNLQAYERQTRPTSAPSASTDLQSHDHQSTAALRTTCEGCRKLKVKRKPGAINGICMKCSKKRQPCVFAPRASYGSKKASKKFA
jgi:hypothetical protein